MLRIKAEDHSYAPPNTAFIYQNPDLSWSCMLGNGTPAAFSYAGIDPNREAECRLRLNGQTDPDEIVKIIEGTARRYTGGPHDGQTVFTYTLEGVDKGHSHLKLVLTTAQFQALGACARAGYDALDPNVQMPGMTREDWTRVEEAITGMENH